MSEAELIARLAMRAEQLSDAVRALEANIDRARRIMICIGGPLNDNRLQYSKEQLVTFVRIEAALNGDTNG